MVSAVPQSGIFARGSVRMKEDVRIASPDIIQSKSENLPVDVMTELIFEDIGGQELINTTRSDMLNGQNVAYDPIKKMPILDLQYDPSIILGLQRTSESFFLNYPIKLFTNTPASVADASQVVYYDPAIKSIVVQVSNVRTTERVEVQIATSGVVYDKTVGADAAIDGIIAV